MMQAGPTQARPPQPAHAETEADQARLFQCSTCKRSFTRADHLTRHVRAHTKSKPYICPVCSKGFARIDLLKRHVANHDTEPANKRQKRGISRDTRVVQACEACSQSHLRCEDEKPCTRCKKKNIPCRVPETLATEENEPHEIDAVHAAQDLLDLSNGFDYPSSTPGHSGSVNPSVSATSQTPESFHNPQHHQTMVDTNRINNHGVSHGRHETTVPVLSSMQPPSNNSNGLVTMDHHYQDQDHASSMAFFDNSMSAFANTPGQNPFVPDHFRNMPPFESFLSGQATPRGILDLSFDIDVGLTDIDLGLLDQYNFQVPFAADTPSTDAQGTENHHLETDTASGRAEAFKQSIWRYLPHTNIKNPSAEQVDSAFSEAERDSNRRAHIAHRRVIAEKLSRVSRDRLMALVLVTCSPQNVQKISSAFPSIELLDALIQYFLSSPSLDAPMLFHLPTFSPSKLNPILLASIASAGATTIPDMSLRRLGYALHEASRMGQARAIEEDNSAIRDLQHLQTFFYQLRLGMWSGISRKMEIAESFLQPLITMLRRGGRFRRSTWKEISPEPDEQGAALDSKWRSWIEQESFLRLVHYTFELDRHSSMSLLKPPLISYAEMHPPLPSANVLWQAKTAASWKATYLNMASKTAKRPSAMECFLDLEHLSHHDYASHTYLYMVWGAIWEYRQMCTVTSRSQSASNHSLILSSRYQELTKQLDDFRLSCPPMNKSVEINLEIMLVHLNAPLDDIQLFAGIEGQEEARTAYFGLQEWLKTPAARQALWHAGQVLRAAEVLPKTLLNNFNAIAVYHAGLILWCYGFLKRSIPQELTQVDMPVVLNSDDSLSARKFITLDRGIPSIRVYGSHKPVQLNDVCGVMDGLIQLLRTRQDASEPCPPLVGNLVQLLEGLRSASK